MKTNKLYIVVGLIIAFSLFSELAAHADESDQATTITFNQSIQIPGQVLPAGTYLFKLANSDSGRDFVQIFNSTGLTSMQLFRQFQRIVRTHRTYGNHVGRAGRRKTGCPFEVVLSRNLTGNEFLYSDQKEKELAHASSRPS